MAPISNEEVDRKDNFTFLSFLQCSSRHTKSVSNDSGLSSSEPRNCQIDQNGVIVISDGEESNEPEFEMLCGVEFESNETLPKPIEQKLFLKSEAEEYSNVCEYDQSRSFNTTQKPLKEEPDTTVNLSECDEELFPLCKVENGDTAFKTNFILFVCPQCGSDFTNSSTWKSHIDKEHNLNDQKTLNFAQRPNNQFQCNKCQTVITRCTLKTLQQHRFSHLPFKVYKCKLCRHDEHSLYLMISHIMLHKEKETEVDVIEASAKKATTAFNSVIEHESKHLIAYICPVCGKIFDTEDTWQAHINFQHNFLEKTAQNRFGDHFKCSECNEEIFSQHIPDLQKHLFTHLQFKSLFKCKVCGWTISRRNFMVSHILNLHKSSITKKNAAATTNDILSTSLPTVFHYDDDDHDDDKTDVTEAEQSANKNSTLMISTSAYPIDISVERRYRNRGFRCTRCSFTFPTASERNAHNVAEHGKYVCPNCNENFAIKSDMKRHNCTKKNSYECPKCSKEYNYEKCFHNHVRRCNFQSTQPLRGSLENPSI